MERQRCTEFGIEKEECVGRWWEGRKGFRPRPGEATASDEIIKRRAGGGGSRDNKAFTWCSQRYAGGIPGIGGQPLPN